MAQLAGMQKRFERAVRLFGAFEAIIGDSKFATVSKNKSYITAARTELSEKAFSEARDEGRAMSLEQAIEYAQGDD